ncbi:MAG TPA: hypothetical protein ENG87_01020 [Candidatus Pacearchaeota archaeon]|nr:hypothetical protein BMS3Abin17_00271 [archaeon BMS3Abin17]HDK41932.1 hypothetical protein [Candidatus Pacearchaeota archaeon]
MRIGIIGPSSLNSVESINKSAKPLISGLAKKLAESGHEIVITPDKGSASEFFAQEYIKNNGKKVFEVLPLDDKEFGYKEWINADLGEHINCGTWRNQPEKLNEETDALVCIGYAVGVLAEIAYSKWFPGNFEFPVSSTSKEKHKEVEHKPKPVYIISELVSGKLPKEVRGSLNLNYVSFSNFKI